MSHQSGFYRFFQLSETGFNVLSILFMVVIVLGVLALIVFRRDLTGKKVMLFGGELILLGFIFNAIIDFKVSFPSLSFITILLGLLISVIGICMRD